MNEKLSPIVTIDGPAGSGKSSLAHALAEELKRPCLDTGAMFRFVALKIGPEALELAEDALLAKLRSLSFALSGNGANSILTCNGEAAGQQLRTEKIGMLASRLAAMPVVRQEMLRAQQQLGSERALIAEGRDMGTVVFPQAALKIFLEARPSTRAMRRLRQLEEAGIKSNPEELEKGIIERDERDRTRQSAPLRPAPDAIIIDTDNLALEEVLAKIRSLAIRKMEALELDPAMISPA